MEAERRGEYAKDHLMCTHLFAMGKNTIVLVKQKTCKGYI